MVWPSRTAADRLDQWCGLQVGCSAPEAAEAGAFDQRVVPVVMVPVWKSTNA